MSSRQDFYANAKVISWLLAFVYLGLMMIFWTPTATPPFVFCFLPYALVAYFERKPSMFFLVGIAAGIGASICSYYVWGSLSEVSLRLLGVTLITSAFLFMPKSEKI